MVLHPRGWKETKGSWFCTGEQCQGWEQIPVYLLHKSPSFCTSLFLQTSSNDSEKLGMPREVMSAPSLEVFKAVLDRA